MLYNSKKITIYLNTDKARYLSYSYGFFHPNNVYSEKNMKSLMGLIDKANKEAIQLMKLSLVSCHEKIHPLINISLRKWRGGVGEWS